MVPRLTSAGVPVTYAQPKGGRLTTQDGLTIAANPEADLDRVYAYLNARTSPETGVFCMTKFGMVNPNKNAINNMPEDVKAKMGVDNIEETIKKARAWKTMSPELKQKYIKIYNEIRAKG
jgi:hypothetical protein